MPEISEIKGHGRGGFARQLRGADDGRAQVALAGAGESRLACDCVEHAL
jgi:hypothetical protein